MLLFPKVSKAKAIHNDIKPKTNKFSFLLAKLIPSYNFIIVLDFSNK